MSNQIVHETELFSLNSQLVTLLDMDLAPRIREQILEELSRRGWTKADLIRATGLRRSRVYEILHKDTPRVPRFDAREAIELALGIRLATEAQPPQYGPAVTSRQGDDDDVQLYGQSAKMADAIDFAVLAEIPVELEGDELMARIRGKRYGRRSVDSDARGVFVLRLASSLGDYHPGERLTLSQHTAPEPEEHVLVRAKGRRWLGQYNVGDDGEPVVTLWGGGGVTKDFKVLATVVEVSHSTLKRPR